MPPVPPLTRVVALTLGALALASLAWAPSEAPPRYGSGLGAPGEVVGDSYVFDLRDDLDDAGVARVREQLGVDLKLVAESARDVGLYTAVLDLEMAMTLASGPAVADIEGIEAEQLFRADSLPAGPTFWGYPNDPGASSQWNLGAIGVGAGWRAGAGRGVIVAVIDTGVTPGPELRNVLPGRSFVPGSPSSADDHGHGTHVAGTIAQATHNGIGVAGIAPAATILPLKVLGGDGSGQTSWIAAAIDAAADDGAHVINLSLGGGSSPVLKRAVERAWARGVIVVAAAGNTGREGLGSPADAEHAIAVSALGPSGEITRYSTWGAGVEIAAPGGDTSVDGGGITQAVMREGEVSLASFQGTSMASPHVAGAAAVLLSLGADPTEATALLLNHARPEGDSLRYGAGRLDLGAAVRAFLVARRGVLFAVGGALGLSVAMLARLTGWRRAITVGVAAISAGGLFFLPMLPLPPSSLGELLSRPFQEWPTWTVLGVRLVGFPLWQAALVPVLTVLIAAPSRRLGAVAVGLTMGVGSYLLYGAATHDIPLWLPMVWGSTWLTVNGTICLLAGLAGAGMMRMRGAA